MINESAIKKADNNVPQQRHGNKTLAQMLKRQRQSIGDAIVILDISGSMGAEVEPGQRRIDVLRGIVKSSIPGNPKMIAFHTYAQECTKDAIPEPQGSTFMSRAFIKAKELGFKNAIMITDGEANDQLSALEEVNGLSLKIIYVGGGNKPEFLDKLAAKAGGFCTQKDLHMPAEIEGELMKLLGSGAPEDGSIKL